MCQTLSRLRLWWCFAWILKIDKPTESCSRVVSESITICWNMKIFWACCETTFMWSHQRREKVQNEFARHIICKIPVKCARHICVALHCHSYFGYFPNMFRACGDAVKSCTLLLFILFSDQRGYYVLAGRQGPNFEKKWSLLTKGKHETFVVLQTFSRKQLQRNGSSCHV